ncbi:hypothetical protein HNP46_004177 [Pseudomonas nitritireducens]|uniref:Uncharacterized protein n=1 Tax=Pseudomonas nitroreducens TaxID=46680 RepID=A0A7W7P279_PSENT|nr:hypothetical protein [Pseudomonas nitritireducens]MBB4865296.1 hypothetical protein [Pseudomonas nitritireducens]
MSQQAIDKYELMMRLPAELHKLGYRILRGNGFLVARLTKAGEAFALDIDQTFYHLRLSAENILSIDVVEKHQGEYDIFIETLDSFATH